MPYRVTHVGWMLLAACGLALVALLVMLRLDVRAAARRGPRWARPALAAGLVLLSALGFSLAGVEDDSRPPAGLAGTQGTGNGLEQDPRWQGVLSAWAQAEEIAGGRKGDYPFDEKGKSKLLGDLQAAAESVDGLQGAGLLDAAESGLLKDGLKQLVAGVQAKRPTEMRMATCYKPMMPRPAHDAAQRLADRLPLLEKLAEGGKLHPAALRVILSKVHQDLAVLEAGRPVREYDLEGEALKAARDRAERARETLRRIDDRLRSVEGDARWGELLETWKEADEVASGKRGPYPFDRKGQNRLLDRLARSKEHVVALGSEGKLEGPEADLLALGLADLTAGVREKRPTEMRQATCYEPMPMPTVQHTLDTVGPRLALLEKLADLERVRPETLRKALSLIEPDLKRLEDKAMLQAASPEAQARARQTAASARTTLQKIQDKLAAAK